MHSPRGSSYTPPRLRARPRLPGASSSTSVDSDHPMSCTLIRVQPSAANSSQSYHGCCRSNIPSPQRNRKRTVLSSVLIKKSCAIFAARFLTHACKTSGLTNGYPWYNVSWALSRRHPPESLLLTSSSVESNHYVNPLNQVALSATTVSCTRHTLFQILDIILNIIIAPSIPKLQLAPWSIAPSNFSLIHPLLPDPSADPLLLRFCNIHRSIFPLFTIIAHSFPPRSFACFLIHNSFDCSLSIASIIK